MQVIYFSAHGYTIHKFIFGMLKIRKKLVINTIVNNINASKINSIYDEYKSKSSYVIKMPIHDKEKLTPINDYDYYNITLDSVLTGHEDMVSSVTWGKMAKAL